MTTYVTDSAGKFIPATQRPDGTWRKARRVKEGYVPQEEVPLYESKGKKFAERRVGQLPPGYYPNVVDTAKNKQDVTKTVKTQSNTKKTQKQAGLINIKTTNNTCTTTSTTNTTATKSTSAITTTTTSNSCIIPTNNLINSCSKIKVQELHETLAELSVEDETLDIAKKLRKLRKKLREIEAIEEKMQKDGNKKFEKDQLDKVKRKFEIIKEIERLSVNETEILTLHNNSIATPTAQHR